MSQLSELRAFVCVARHRNFRAAAAELRMSPSALSHAIATLEAELGVRLFHRTTRSVALSDAGEHLLARVTPALEQLTQAVETLDGFRATPRGTLRINTSQVAARWVLMPYVREYVKRFPDVQLELVTEDRLVDIVADGFDAGVRTTDLVPRDMVAVECSPRIRYVIAGAPSYFARRQTPKRPDDLLKHECIRFRMSNGRVYRWDLERRGKVLSLEVNGPLTVSSDQLVHQAALDGIGLGYFSEFMVAEDLAAGRLVRVLESWVPEDDALSLYYPGHRHVPASLRAFVDVIKELRGRR
ncbi:LysR family transcriptional regulator [Corallococcus terminator]|uniref:LysR family transcriptional regulator n=1 Tax=Corallococcus terminator TaxID=2316733 RepID=A0A3A8JDF1_9BACT|nr:LysR family transcriptional regulator [Corallococcus terminator]RKG93867.1 LysR family transcriptional regulator [Corallococcus terminator]